MRKGTHLVLDSIILQTELPGLALHARGKVRDIYTLDERLLFVATDRISAFDYILASGIPAKGKVLSQLSLFWFDFLKDIISNHVITADFNQYPESLRDYEELRGRSMIVSRAEMVPVECVVRGYLSGSGWKDYQRTGAVCGIELPKGMRESDKLPEPIFTPAMKATSGHDENISFAEMVKRAGPKVSEELRDISLRLYKKASEYALARGIIIADSKFEFGMTADGLVLADEVFTPDSSRFWPAESYSPGGPQLSFDKQYVRDYLESIKWNKQPPAPGLPDDVAEQTSQKYKQAYRQLTGHELTV
ncbi:MAG: phosphoribosylaminoimidazole-succinocarboxamide synthase [Acidobacteriales bacterium]|nr:phosphoribosylaminoimidazole-succinocarboxamide synthase [Terriglobales bacterium]